MKNLDSVMNRFYCTVHTSNNMRQIQELVHAWFLLKVRSNKVISVQDKVISVQHKKGKKKCKNKAQHIAFYACTVKYQKCHAKCSKEEGTYLVINCIRKMSLV